MPQQAGHNGIDGEEVTDLSDLIVTSSSTSTSTSTSSPKSSPTSTTAAATATPPTARKGKGGRQRREQLAPKVEALREKLTSDYIIARHPFLERKQGFSEALDRTEAIAELGEDERTRAKEEIAASIESKRHDFVKRMHEKMIPHSIRKLVPEVELRLKQPPGVRRQLLEILDKNPAPMSRFSLDWVVQLMDECGYFLVVPQSADVRLLACVDWLVTSFLEGHSCDYVRYRQSFNKLFTNLEKLAKDNTDSGAFSNSKVQSLLAEARVIGNIHEDRGKVEELLGLHSDPSSAPAPAPNAAAAAPAPPAPAPAPPNENDEELSHEDFEEAKRIIREMKRRRSEGLQQQLEEE